MKFARIIRNFGDHAYRQRGFNVGDAIQDYTIEYLYKQLGIPDSQVIGIRSCDVQKYDGEYALLPVASIPLGTRGLGALPFSPNIIPVFISAHFLERELTEDVVQYLRRFEPIGCRDEYSMSILREHGISCTMTGCLTMVLPSRRNNVENGKVFFVDVPESVSSFVPNNIMDRVEKVTHLIPFNGDYPDNDESAARYYERSIKLLQRYKTEASLVVSSRLHALAPCMAMGIPVIAITENISERFSWIDKYLKIYTPKTINEVDWNVSAVDYCHEKDVLARYFTSAIQHAYDKWELPCDISWYYETRKKAMYGSRYIEALSQAEATRDGGFDYIIWGCGLIGETVYRVIKQHYPDARLIAAVDRYASGLFHGLQIESPEVIQNVHKENPDAVVLLASYSGRDDGFSFMHKLGVKEGKGFVYLGTQNG